MLVSDSCGSFNLNQTTNFSISRFLSLSLTFINPSLTFHLKNLIRISLNGYENITRLSGLTNGLTECIRSRTANLFLATQTAVRPDDLFPSGAEKKVDSVSL